MECIAYIDTSVGHQALPNARATIRALHAPFRVFVRRRRRPLEEFSQGGALALPECGNRRFRTGDCGGARETCASNPLGRGNRARRLLAKQAEARALPP